MTIVFKNATVANEPFDEDALKRQLFPDQETFTKEEQRRFEILDGHWDVPVKGVELDSKSGDRLNASWLALDGQAHRLG